MKYLTILSLLAAFSRAGETSVRLTLDNNVDLSQLTIADYEREIVQTQIKFGFINVNEDKRNLRVGNFGNVNYLTVVYLGTPPKPFRVLIDTASGDLYVASKKCDSEVCTQKNQYDSSASSSYTDLGREFSSRNASGKIALERVQLDRFGIGNQPFGEATTLNNIFTGIPIDGVLGFGFRPTSVLGAPSPIETLVTLNAIKEPIFSLYLNGQPNTVSSELLIGETNKDLYVGRIKYTPVTRKAFWEVGVREIRVNNKKLSIDTKSAILSTTTALILLPAKDAQAINEQLKGTQTARDGVYMIPCDPNLPEVSIRVPKVGLLKISPLNYILRVNETTCISAFAPGSTGSTSVFGNAFIRSYYTVYDYKDGKVGFASLKSN